MSTSFSIVSTTATEVHTDVNIYNSENSPCELSDLPKQFRCSGPSQRAGQFLTLLRLISKTSTARQT